MNFAEALTILRAGARVTRQEWSPGNFLVLEFTDGALFMSLFVDNGTRRLNWSPTQREIMADDWEEAPKPAAQGVSVSGMSVFGPMGGR